MANSKQPDQAITGQPQGLIENSVTCEQELIQQGISKERAEIFAHNRKMIEMRPWSFGVHDGLPVLDKQGRIEGFFNGDGFDGSYSRVSNVPITFSLNLDTPS